LVRKNGLTKSTLAPVVPMMLARTLPTSKKPTLTAGVAFKSALAKTPPAATYKAPSVVMKVA
jgi:hypothetical protein